MEKKISELLNYIQDDTVSFRTREAVSVERIKEAVMKSIYTENPRRGTPKKLRRFGGIAVAAALALVLLTGAAFAATNTFGVGDYFTTLFGGMNDGQIDLLENISKTDFSPVSSNGTTVTPLAAISDDDNYYLLLRVEAPEGVEFRKLQDGEVGYMSDVEVFGLPYSVAYTRWDVSDALPKNTAEVTIVIRTNDNSGQTKISDGSERRLQLRNIYIAGQTKDDKFATPFLEGVWDIDITRSYEAEKLNISANGAVAVYTEKYSGDKFDMTIGDIALTNIGITYSYSFRSDTKMIYVSPKDVSVILNDGTVVKAVWGWELAGIEMTTADDLIGEQAAEWLDIYRQSRTGNFISYDCTDSFSLASPIRLEDVRYISFADVLIPVK